LSRLLAALGKSAEINAVPYQASEKMPASLSLISKSFPDYYNIILSAAGTDPAATRRIFNRLFDPRGKLT